MIESGALLGERYRNAVDPPTLSRYRCCSPLPSQKRIFQHAGCSGIMGNDPDPWELKMSANKAWRLIVAASLCLAAATASSPALSLTRCEVIADAQSWVDNQVPYCQGPGGYYCTNCDPCYYDPLRGGQCYRSDCSGFVSATWSLASPGPATGGLCSTGEQISWDALEPGDALVACSDHAMLFAGWTVPGVKFNVYEETSCGNPAHVAEHDRYGDSYWGNMEAYPFLALRLPGIAPCAPPDAPPVGWIDAVGCDRIGGWSQDPDAPTSPVDVHVYFGGPSGSGAPAVAVHANLHRDDLCAALGSCEHGFSLPPPLSLFNGQPHPIHAYGIDLNGPNNAELSGSPQTLTCAPTVPAGVKRHVINPDSFAAWKLDEFWDALPAGDAEIAKLAAGEDMPAAPKLVIADDGTPEVWVADGTHRRHVPNPDVMAAWGFDWNAIQKLPASQVYALAKGPAMRPRPVLLHQTDGTIWLADDPFDAETGSDAGAGGSAGSGGDGGASGHGGNGGNTSLDADTHVPEDSGADPDGSSGPMAGWSQAQGDQGSCRCNVMRASSSPAGFGAIMALVSVALLSRKRAAITLGIK